MRLIVVLCLLTGPMIAFGWPPPWLLACSAFAAGFIARRPGGGGRAPRRPGYLPLPVSNGGSQGVAERVATSTGYLMDGLLLGGEAAQRMRAERSSSTGPGGSTDGASPGSGMGGCLGLLRDAAVTSEGRLRFEAYRQRLSPEQLVVFDQLHGEAQALGDVPLYARTVMAQVGPWPDPCEPGCEGCNGA